MTPAEEILSMLSTRSKLSQFYVCATLYERFDPAHVDADLDALIGAHKVIRFHLDDVAFLKLPTAPAKRSKRSAEAEA